MPTLGVFLGRSSPYLLRQGLILNLDIIDGLGELVSELQGSTCLFSTYFHIEVAGTHCTSGFYMHARDPTSYPHAGEASI